MIRIERLEAIVYRYPLETSANLLRVDGRPTDGCGQTYEP